MKKWYVLQVYTGFEQVVKADLASRIKEEGMQDLFGEILVPTGKSVDLFAADKEKEEKIFPGYLLVQMEMTGDTFRIVSMIPRVTRFLGGQPPVPISNKEIEHIFSQIEGKILVAPSQSAFVEGNEIQISSGPFTGYVGIVDRIVEEHEMLVVKIPIFGRLTEVDVKFDQVKK